jgi:hypothetical protein
VQTEQVPTRTVDEHARSGAVGLARASRAGETTAREAVELCIGGIEALDPAVNAVVLRRFGKARDVTAPSAIPPATHSMAWSTCSTSGIVLAVAFLIAGLGLALDRASSTRTKGTREAAARGALCRDPPARHSQAVADRQSAPSTASPMGSSSTSRKPAEDLGGHTGSYRSGLHAANREIGPQDGFACRAET